MNCELKHMLLSSYSSSLIKTMEKTQKEVHTFCQGLGKVEVISSEFKILGWLLCPTGMV